MVSKAFKLDCFQCEKVGSMEQINPFMYKCKFCKAKIYPQILIYKSPPEAST